MRLYSQCSFAIPSSITRISARQGHGELEPIPADLEQEEAAYSQSQGPLNHSDSYSLLMANQSFQTTTHLIFFFF